MINRAFEICRLFYINTQNLISLTHGSTVPLDVLTGLQEKLFHDPILKQQDYWR